jgi:hypothetical protein
MQPAFAMYHDFLKSEGYPDKGGLSHGMLSASKRRAWTTSSFSAMN